MTRAFTPLSLRLNRRTIARLRQLAAERGTTTSAVVREAIVQFGVDEPRTAARQSALDRLRRYVGVISTGGAQHASNAHAHFREHLEEKRRARRPR